MNHKENAYGIGCLLLGGVIVLLMMLAAMEWRCKILKAEAIQRGFATWVADEYGNTTFTWKETHHEHTTN